MFRFGHTELIIILVLIFILFGHRLPSVMRSLGRGVVEFQHHERRRDDDPYWLTAIEVLMIGVVVAVLAALLMVMPG